MGGALAGPPNLPANDLQQYYASLGAIQQQAAAQFDWHGLQNLFGAYTTVGTTTTSSATVALAPPPAAPTEPAEYTWLKRRVREIEWRA